MNFVSDSLKYGRRLKCLTIVDDYTKEAIDIPVDHGISGECVPRVLRTDQGPEVIGNALDRWAYRNRVTLRLIQAGKPTQNAYVQSFNGKFCDECLNEHWFRSLAEAREIIGACASTTSNADRTARSAPNVRRVSRRLACPVYRAGSTRIEYGHQLGLYELTPSTQKGGRSPEPLCLYRITLSGDYYFE